MWAPDSCCRTLQISGAAGVRTWGPPGARDDTVYEESPVPWGSQKEGDQDAGVHIQDFPSAEVSSSGSPPLAAGKASTWGTGTVLRAGDTTWQDRRVPQGIHSMAFLKSKRKSHVVCSYLDSMFSNIGQRWGGHTSHIRSVNVTALCPVLLPCDMNHSRN